MFDPAIFDPVIFGARVWADLPLPTLTVTAVGTGAVSVAAVGTGAFTVAAVGALAIGATEPGSPDIDVRTP